VPVAFTARLPGAAYEERVWAAETADALAVDLRRIDVGWEDYIAHTERLISVKDQPLGMHNEVAMYLLARAVRAHGKVVLCGEGADELFAGYGRIFRFPFDVARRGWLARIPSQRARDYVTRALELDRTSDDTVAQFLTRYTYFSSGEKRALFRASTWNELDDDRPLTQRFATIFREAEGRSLFARVWLVFQRLHLPGLLGMLDAATMAASVEARVPFLDHRITEFAFALPDAAKLAWRSRLAALRATYKSVAQFSEVEDVPKHILRRAYAQRLPRGPLERRKQGFPVPLGQWIAGPGRRWLDGLLLTKESRVRAFLEDQPLRAWLDRQYEAANDAAGKRCWQMANLEMFLRAYF
jgi:asparagine synthase (glutamine-hydrolysing)